MKRERTIFLVAALFIMLLSIPRTAVANSFDDVPRSHWAYDAVEYLASKGLVEGYPDGTFQGGKTMTRYELAMIIARTYAKLENQALQGESAGIDVEVIMKDLMKEFESEIGGIRDLVRSNKSKIDDLERQLQENSQKDADLAAKFDKLAPKFTFNGEFRLRYEGVFNHHDDSRTNRPRTRFRFNMKAPVNDEIEFGARLGTGGTTTLTNEFKTKNFVLERAFVQWKPESAPNWTFWGGKFGNVWNTPAIWFDDTNVEGLAGRYKAEENWLFSLSAMAPADKGLYIVGEIGAEDIIAKNLKAYLTYHHVTSGAFETLGAAFPYQHRINADDYNALEAYVRYTFDDWTVPVGIDMAYRQNLASKVDNLPENEDSGLLNAAMARLQIGRARNVGEYDFWLQWSKTLPNAVLPQFDDSAYGANRETWAAGMNYMLHKNTVLALKYDYVKNLVTHPDRGFDRITVDVNMRF